MPPFRWALIAVAGSTDKSNVNPPRSTRKLSIAQLFDNQFFLGDVHAIAFPALHGQMMNV
jgi:hypothetical protein